MKRLGIVIALALGLAGCSTIQNLQGLYNTVTTAQVSAGNVVVVANAFDALKATAINYAGYCKTQNFPQPQCSAANRRLVIKAVNAGTSARIQLEASINTGQPAVASVYNALVAAVNTLQTSPINSVKGS